MTEKPANPKQSSRWGGAGTIITTVLIFFAAQLVAGIVVFTVLPLLLGWDRGQALAWLQDSIPADFMYFLMAGFLTLYFLWRVLARLQRDFRSIGLVKPRLRDVPPVLAGYVVYMAALLVIGNILAPLLNLDVNQEQQIGFQDAAGAVQLGMVFIALVVIPPIVEEVLMRGFLYEGLKRRYTKRLTALLTSVIFAVAHLQWGNGAPLLWIAALDTFILSLVLIHLKERTGGLTAPILLHALKNGVAFAALFIFV